MILVAFIGSARAWRLVWREQLVRRKWLLDGIKDKSHKKYDASFMVVLELQKGAPPSGLASFSEMHISGAI